MLTPERAVGGTLKKGDLVGVYLSFDPFNWTRRADPSVDDTDRDGPPSAPPDAPDGPRGPTTRARPRT